VAVNREDRWACQSQCKMLCKVNLKNQAEWEGRIGDSHLAARVEQLSERLFEVRRSSLLKIGWTL
jgi:hypothetical protein